MIRRLFNAVRILQDNPALFLKKMSRLYRPIRQDYRMWDKMTLRQWLLYHQRNIVFTKCSWMGVGVQKNPFDAWIYQEIIYEVKPDVIVEIGGAAGGSTLYIANLLDILGKGEVISIDISRSEYSTRHPRIREITGDSSALETIAKVSEFCRNKSVLVIHDGGHTSEQVLKDLKSYSKFVSVNSYFIVEDGIIDLFKPEDGIGTFEDGPLVAIEEFLKSNPNFVVDKERERYVLTYNPCGFLKRIR